MAGIAFLLVLASLVAPLLLVWLALRAVQALERTASALEAAAGKLPRT